MLKIQYDGNKLIHHLDRVQKWKQGELIRPIYVAFSPTSLCNHHCVFCVYHYKEFKPIYYPLESYKVLVKDLSKSGVKSMFFAGDGDPLLNKSCVEMVYETKMAGIDVALNTNGRLLKKEDMKILLESLSFIRVSLNAGSEDSYSKIHGCKKDDFEIVISNLKALVEIKKSFNFKTTIGVQCVLLSQNIDEIEELAILLKEIGVNYLAVKPFLKHPGIEFDDKIDNLDERLERFEKFKTAISDEKFSFVLRRNLFIEQQKRNYRKCLSTDFMIEIDALGDVYSCGPYIGVDSHKLGNVIHNTFENVWQSEQSRQVREYIRNKVDVSKCMPSCRPDSVNQFLWDIQNPPDHINFI